MEETKQVLEQEIKDLEEEKEVNIIVDEDTKGDYKRIKRQKRQRRWFIFWNLLSILYYAISSFISIKRGFKNDVFTYIILAAVIIYTIIFIVIIIKTSSNKKIAKTNIKTFNNQIKIARILLSFFNIILTINILVNALLNEKHWLVILLIIFGFMFVGLRIFIAIIKLFILVIKQSKINQKRRKLQEKYLQKNSK